MLVQRYRPALAELEQFAQETAIPAVQSTLAHQLEPLKRTWDTDQIPVLLVYYGEPMPDEVTALAALLLPDWPDLPADLLNHRAVVPLMLRHLPAQLRILSAGEALTDIGQGQRPLLLWAMFFAGATAFDDRWAHLESIAADVPVTVVTAPDSLLREARPTVARLLTNTLDVTAQSWPNLPPGAGWLTQWLVQLGNERFDMLHAYRVLNGLEEADRVLQMVLRAEEKNLKAKRQLSQQQLTRVQNRATAQPSGDLLALVKNNLHNQFALFEKGVNEQLDKTFRPNVGSFGKDVDNVLSHLTELDETARTKTTELRIPTAVEQQFLDLHRTRLTDLGLRDLRAMKDLFELALADAERQFQSREVPFTSVHLRYATMEPLENMVQSVVYAERAYRGEQLRRGPYEYFMAARKYQMLMMMTVSTLGLSVLTRYKQYMVPLTILLIGLGGYNVWKSVGKERLESTEKELLKARDGLRTESKRMTNDFSRQWSRWVGDYLKEQYNQLLLQLETSFKSQMQQMQAVEDEEKRKLQRIMVGMEGTERRLESVARNRVGWERNLTRAKAELRTQYVNVMKQARRPA